MLKTKLSVEELDRMIWAYCDAKRFEAAAQKLVNETTSKETVTFETKDVQVSMLKALAILLEARHSNTESDGKYILSIFQQLAVPLDSITFFMNSDRASRFLATNFTNECRLHLQSRLGNLFSRSIESPALEQNSKPLLAQH